VERKNSGFQRDWPQDPEFSQVQERLEQALSELHRRRGLSIRGEDCVSWLMGHWCSQVSQACAPPWRAGQSHQPGWDLLHWWHWGGMGDPRLGAVFCTLLFSHPNGC